MPVCVAIGSTGLDVYASSCQLIVAAASFTPHASVMVMYISLQLKYILGYDVPRSDTLILQARDYANGIQGFKWQEYIMGTMLLTYMLTMKFFGKRWGNLPILIALLHELQHAARGVWTLRCSCMVYASPVAHCVSH